MPGPAPSKLPGREPWRLVAAGVLIAFAVMAALVSNAEALRALVGR